MSLDNKVRAALRRTIEGGLVAEVHTSRHERYVEGAIVPEEVNVTAVLNAPSPEEHRDMLESLLNSAGFRKVVLCLHGQADTADPSSENAVSHVSAEVIGTDEMRARERAYLLWEAEGRPEGRLDEYWDRACELIDDESQSSYPPAQSRGHRT
jgi:hypothetical protein